LNSFSLVLFIYLNCWASLQLIVIFVCLVFSFD